MDIAGKTMLERVIEQVKKAKLVDDIVVALPIDQSISCSVHLFMGDENNVLQRYFNCATCWKADIIVRITADCPLVDPEIIDYAIDYFNKHSFPYVTFAPVDGLDVEVFSYELLKETYKNAVLPYDREHVTPYMKRKTKCSVDTLEELNRVRGIWIGQTKPVS